MEVCERLHSGIYADLTLSSSRSVFFANFLGQISCTPAGTSTKGRVKKQRGIEASVALVKSADAGRRGRVVEGTILAAKREGRT